MRIIVIVFLFAIIASLGRALVLLVRQPAASPQLVRALTWRVALSIALFCLLLLAKALGLWS